MNRFNYIIERVSSADISSYPYPHLEINDFLQQDHLETILTEINVKKCKTHEELIGALLDKKYKIISGAGIRMDADEYLKALNDKGSDVDLGMGFKFVTSPDMLVDKLLKFVRSQAFHNCLKEKFNIQERPTTILSDVRKYLTGYEISPHPDMRIKAMTYLLNLNDPQAEDFDVHTHVLAFKKEYEYMYKQWEKEVDTEREWVPWEWCDTIKTISKNNAIIIFPPGNASLHAVKLDYNHLEFQRTQLYGNLWFKDMKKKGGVYRMR